MPWPLLAIGIGAALGGGLGLLSTALESDKEQEQLRQQKELAWSRYLLGREHSDTQFNLQKTEAVGQLALQQRRLRQEMDQSVAQTNAALTGQAYEAQDARIQTASAIGASLAAEGAGGTRGSSGAGLMRSYQQQSLDRGLALQQQQNALSLAGLVSQADNARQDLERERASWMAGGYRYESKQAEDAYNKSLAELGQTDLDWQINAAAAGPLDYLLGAFSGASSGMTMAASVYDFTKYYTGGSKDSFDGVGG
jgi:hypothetical protein